jgi:hypothetical protein
MNTKAASPKASLVAKFSELPEWRSLFEQLNAA